MNKGVVIGVDRTNMVAAVALQGSGVTVTASWLDQQPPPRSVVWLEDLGSGSWMILGTSARQRLLLHDDFLFSGNVNLNGFGDTWWGLLVAPAGGNPTVTGVTSDGRFAGGLFFVTAATSGNYAGLSKSNANTNAPVGAAIWLAGRQTVDGTFNNNAQFTGLANPTAAVGFSNAAGAQAVGLYMDSVRSPKDVALRVVNGATVVDTATGVVLAAGAAFDFDLVWMVGGWAALWINGVLAARYSGAALLPAGANVTPVWGWYPRANQACGGVLDFFHMELLNGKLVIAP